MVAGTPINWDLEEAWAVCREEPLASRLGHLQAGPITTNDDTLTAQCPVPPETPFINPVTTTTAQLSPTCKLPLSLCISWECSNGLLLLSWQHKHSSRSPLSKRVVFVLRGSLSRGPCWHCCTVSAQQTLALLTGGTVTQVGLGLAQQRLPADLLSSLLLHDTQAPSPLLGLQPTRQGSLC